MSNRRRAVWMTYFLQSQEKSLEVNADENSIGINEQEQETVF